MPSFTPLLLALGFLVFFFIIFLNVFLLSISPKGEENVLFMARTFQ